MCIKIHEFHNRKINNSKHPKNSIKFACMRQMKCNPKTVIVLESIFFLTLSNTFILEKVYRQKYIYEMIFVQGFTKGLKHLLTCVKKHQITNIQLLDIQKFSHLHKKWLEIWFFSLKFLMSHIDNNFLKISAKNSKQLKCGK